MATDCLLLLFAIYLITMLLARLQWIEKQNEDQEQIFQGQAGFAANWKRTNSFRSNLGWQCDQMLQ